MRDLTNLSAVRKKFKAFRDETLLIIITFSLEKRDFTFKGGGYKAL